MKKPGKSFSSEMGGNSAAAVRAAEAAAPEVSAAAAPPAKEEKPARAAAPAPVPSPFRRLPAPVPIVGDSFAVPDMILIDYTLKAIEKLVLISLYRFADPSGLSAPPSQSVLARLCSTTDFWIRETLKGLEKRGYIRAIEKGRKKEYQISIE